MEAPVEEMESLLPNPKFRNRSIGIISTLCSCVHKPLGLWILLGILIFIPIYTYLYGINLMQHPLSVYSKDQSERSKWKLDITEVGAFGNHGSSQGPTFSSSFFTSFEPFLQMEIQHLETLDYRQSLHEDPPLDDFFDYVIVGAGTSGCILASRLSLKHRVLLLESGDDPPSIVDVPGLDGNIVQFRGSINTFYPSVPQTAADGRVVETSVGNMLGGSYSHNGMMVNRGSRYDYDNWARILGDRTFTYENMLKFFKKLENYTGEYPGPQHGRNGLLPVITDKAPIGDTWFAAGRELGYEKGDPLTTEKSIFASVDCSIRGGRRCTTYTEYIQPILISRTNLKVVRNARVENIKFINRVADCVIYRRHGKLLSVRPTKEIILTAGTFGTALILFRSGIGPHKMLEEAEIPLVIDLPVGKSFEDQVAVHLDVRTDEQLAKVIIRPNDLTRKEFEKYLEGQPDTVLSRTGAGPQALLTSTLASSFNGKFWPDLQLMITEALPLNNFRLHVVNGRPVYNQTTLGSVKLNSTAYKDGLSDPSKLLLIDHKLCQSDTVNKVLLEGIRIAEDILDTNAFRAVGLSLVPFQNCTNNEIEFKTEEYWNCFIKANGVPYMHPVGTCRMGRSSRGNSGGVVDSKFRVFGLSRLRIADGSVIPKIPCANTNIPIAALAEKAAATILENNV